MFFRIIQHHQQAISRKIQTSFIGKCPQKYRIGRLPFLGATNRLTRFSNKRGRGRPRRIDPAWVIGRADNYRIMLKQVWSKLSGPLVAAKTGDDLATVFEICGQPYYSEFVPRLTDDILQIVRAADFPKRPAARIAFLADSLGGRPNISYRSSRDVCGRERAKQRAKSPHKVLCVEFYIECSCGYKGPSRNNACRKCGAEIPLELEALLNPWRLR
jgi:hypothetical protein